MAHHRASPLSTNHHRTISVLRGDGSSIISAIITQQKPPPLSTTDHRSLSAGLCDDGSSTSSLDIGPASSNLDLQPFSFGSIPVCYSTPQPISAPAPVPSSRIVLQKISANRMKQRLQRSSSIHMDAQTQYASPYPSAPASPPTPAPSPTPTRQMLDWSLGMGVDGDSSTARAVQAVFASMDDTSRKVLLAELLGLCSVSQLSFVHNNIAPRLKRDPFSVLPDEICLRVLSYVDDARTLAQVSQLSRRWHTLVSDDSIWKLLCFKHEYIPWNYSPPLASARPVLATSDDIAMSITRRLQTHDTDMYPTVDHPPPPGLLSSEKQSLTLTDASYKAQYKHRFRVDVAWRKGGRCKIVHKTANTVVATNVQITDTHIIVTRDNSKIHVFNLDGTEVRDFQGHNNGVWAMDIFKDTLVTGGCDREVRVWSLSTGASTHVMGGHTSTVRCLRIVDETTAVSGSRDSSVRVWDLQSGICRFVLLGHQASVRCLDVYGDNVASGAYDNTARLWNIKEGVLLQEFEGHTNHIYAIIYNGTYVITGSLDTTIRVWNPTTGECIRILQGHTSLVGHLQLRGTTLVSGGSDGTVRIWSMSTFEVVNRIAAHDNSVISLQFDDTRIVSGGSDGRVKVWDLKTGYLIRELGAPSSSIWRAAFTAEKAVILANRKDHTIMEVWSFDPPHEEEAPIRLDTSYFPHDQRSVSMPLKLSPRLNSTSPFWA